MTHSDITFEIEKGKGCPEGQHSHDGSIHCHPKDKPHKPGSKSDLAHRKLGIPNSWYEMHGTTQADYDKEHGGESEEESKEPEKPKEPEAPKEPKQSTAIDYEKSFKKSHEQAEKMKKAKEQYVDNYDESKSVVDNFKGFLKASGLDPKLSANTSKMLKQVNPTKFKEFMGAYAEVAQLCPIAVSCLEDIKVSTRDGPLMNSDSIDGSFYLFVNVMNYTHDQYKEVKVYDPVTKKKETWSFHFNGQTSYNCISHEYGHSVACIISELVAKKKLGEEIPKEVDVKALIKEFTPVSLKRTATRASYNLYAETPEMIQRVNLQQRTVGEVDMARVKECKKAYAEIFGMDESEIQPSDVFSGYGYYGPSSYWTRAVWYDKDSEGYARMPDMGSIGKQASAEIVAEAYCDVCVRKDKANSMSHLVVMHTHYELAQLVQGYEGTFMDYLRENMDLETFKKNKVIKRMKPRVGA